MVELENMSAKITDRRVVVGHSHMHTHKGRHGAHIESPVEFVRFSSREKKDEYMIKTNNCLEKKKLLVLLNEFEGAEEVEPEQFECLDKPNRIEAFERVICECGENGPALESDFKTNVVATDGYEYKASEGFKQCGCKSVNSKIFKGSLTRFEYAYAISMVRKSRQESRKALKEDEGKAIETFKNTKKCVTNTQVKILKTW